MILFILACLSCFVWFILFFFRGKFWQLRPPKPIAYLDFPYAHWPDVVAVIPARNEADVIEQALISLLEQDYLGHFQIIVIDDHSTDQTAQHVEQLIIKYQARDRLILKLAADLPLGWSGKVWAQAQAMEWVQSLSLKADYILFTDADIAHAPNALTQLVARAKFEQRDLVSLMVRLQCRTWWEKACIPAFVYFFAKLYPFHWVNNVQRSTAGAAGGCMLVKHAALKEIGGMQAIRDALIDDCTLAEKIKHRHAQPSAIRLDLAEHSISLRAYSQVAEIWNMIARTAFTQLHYSFGYLIITLLGMCLVYCVPVLAIFCLKGAWAYPAYLALITMCLSYLPILRYYQRSIIWIFALPWVALFYQAATVASAIRYWRGKGGQWKARVQAPLDMN